MKKCKFTAVVLRHNGFDMTMRALCSLYSTRGCDLQVILVDNGSTDNKIDDITNVYSNLIVVKNNDNLSYCAAYNIGIQKALLMGAEYINITHNDSYDFSEDYFCKMFLSFQANKNIALLGSKGISQDGQVEWGGENHKKFGIDMNTPTYGYAISRKSFDKVGLFDEQLQIYFEDLDYILRLRRAGFETGFEGSVQFTHSGSGDLSISGRYLQKKFHFLRLRNMFWLIKKHHKDMPVRAVVASIISHSATHFSILWSVLRKNDFYRALTIAKSIVQGYLSGIFLWPK